MISRHKIGNYKNLDCFLVSEFAVDAYLTNTGNGRSVARARLSSFLEARI